MKTTFKTVEHIMKAFNELKDLSTVVAQRMDKYSKMGEFKVNLTKY
jgi:hypothetical protein